MVSIDGNWTDADDDSAAISWVREAWADVAKFGTGGVYLNFTGYRAVPGRVGAEDGPVAVRQLRLR